MSYVVKFQTGIGPSRKPLTKLPNLVENQILSYKDLTEKGIAEIFREFSPLRDYSERKFELEFLSFELSAPKYDEVYAKENKLTYEAPLRARVRLANKILNTTKEQEIFMADFPLMTVHGTFIINGVERVVVPLPLEVFIKMVEDSRKADYVPEPQHIQRFFERSNELANTTANEVEWYNKITEEALNWLTE
jgi:DNA-directed RNA polymerase beta subunit